MPAYPLLSRGNRAPRDEVVYMPEEALIPSSPLVKSVNTLEGEELSQEETATVAAA